MMRTFYVFICLSCFFIPLKPAVSQTADTSARHLSSLIRRQDFYNAQVQKKKVPESRKTQYKTELEGVEKEIAEIRALRLAAFVSDPEKRREEEGDIELRDLDVSLMASEPPAVYAYEYNSWQLQLGVAFLSKKQSWPVMLSVEKAFHEKISGGAYVSHFIEKDRTFNAYPGDEWAYYKTNTVNYIYDYYGFGLKGTYHFFNVSRPPFALNPVNFDLYTSLLLGYNMVSGAKPHIATGQYDVKPEKDGINYGVLAGLKYAYNEHLGFHIEGGYSRTGYAAIGFSWRFVEKPVIKDPPVEEVPEPQPVASVSLPEEPDTASVVPDSVAAAQVKAQQDSAMAAEAALAAARQEEQLKQVMQTNKVSSDSLQLVAKAFEDAQKNPEKSNPEAEGITFKIQLYATSKPIDINSPDFKGLTGVSEYKDEGLYKYTIGQTKNLTSAYQLLVDVRSKGFSDAFLAVFNNNKRIPVQEALKIVRKQSK